MIKAATTIEGEGFVYYVETFPAGECTVKLLPQGPLLFSAPLEWLEEYGFLEDGDAVHEVPLPTATRISQWARQNGFRT